jgi:hypothetical protein
VGQDQPIAEDAAFPTPSLSRLASECGAELARECGDATGNGVTVVGRADFSQSFAPLLAVLSGSHDSFEVGGTITGPIDGGIHRVDLRIAKWGDQAFDLECAHADYAVSVYRRPGFTALALPKHGVVYVGSGAIVGPDHLELPGIIERLISRGSMVSTYAPMVLGGDAQALGAAVKTLLNLTPGEGANVWVGSAGTQLEVDPAKPAAAHPAATFHVRHDQWSAQIHVRDNTQPRT